MNEKLLLQDIVVLLAKKAGTTQKDADRFYRELFQLILDCIYENDIVKIKDFGTFKLVSISSRESVDVNTGEKIEIPAHFRLSFAPDKSLKELVNKPFAQFESVVLDDDITALSDEDDEDDLDDEILEEEDRPVFNEIEIPETELLISENINIPVLDKTGDDIQIKEESNLADIGRVNSEKSVENKEIAVSYEEGTPVNSEKIKLEKEYQYEASTDRIKNNPAIKEPEIEKENLQVEEKFVSDFSNELPSRKSVANNTESSIEVNKNNSTGIDKAPTLERNVSEIVSQDKNGVVDQDDSDFDDIDNEENDFDYGYRDYEKQNASTKIKKRLPIIISVVIIGIFAIYQFAKLFDVTYDYEYYIGRTHNLTLTDTLPYLDEISTPEKLSDTLLADMDKVHQQDDILGSDERVSLPETPHETIGASDSYNNASPDQVSENMAKGILEKEPSDLDALAAKLDSSNAFPKDEYQISQNLLINVVNKAELFLRKSLKE